MAFFREASSSDVGMVVELVESAYRGPGSRRGWTTEADLLDGQRTDAQEVTELLADPDCHLLLAVEEPGTLLGCCQFRRLGGGVAYFGMFAVRPQLQGAGLGGGLLEEAEQRARKEWDAAVMRLTVLRQRKELIAWYERRGYEQTGGTEPFPYGDSRFGLPRRNDLEFLVLEKSLA